MSKKQMASSKRLSFAEDLIEEYWPWLDKQRIIEAIHALATDPRPLQSRKLSGAEKYRLRCGVYRVLYEIQEEILVVCVVKVGHRRDVYRS